MPLYCYRCEDGHVTEKMLRMIDLVDEVSCEFETGGNPCGKVGKYVFLSPEQARDAQPVDPVVVYRKVDGSGYIYPGDSSPRNYEGAVRVELRTLGELRAVGREQDRLDREHWELTRQREEEVQGPARQARRAQLLADLHTNFGKDFARLAMAQLDARRAGRRYDPRSYFEVAEVDRSNREAQYDASTGWKGRRA